MGMTADLPEPDQLFDHDSWLSRWPSGVQKTEMFFGVLVFYPYERFDARDVDTAERTYPGRVVVLNEGGQIEVHPSNADPVSIFDPSNRLRG